MIKKLFVLIITLLLLRPAETLSQVKPVFSGDKSLFSEELIPFMGPNLSEAQKQILNSFVAAWDSSEFKVENTSLILSLSKKLAARQIRAVPQFIEFLSTINDFRESDSKSGSLGIWLKGLDRMVSNNNTGNNEIVDFIKNTGLTVRENVLINTGSVSWKIKNADLKFVYDTVLHFDANDATLTCVSQRDSTEIFNVSGSYFPERKIFRVRKGRVTWEKAGYPVNDVYADIADFNIITTRNGFSTDSAKLRHRAYFGEPVYGVLTDQAISISSREKAAFPRFETYIRHFKIPGIYKGIDYEGGLVFEGASVKGRGEDMMSAEIVLHKNDTVLIRIRSEEFIFSLTGIASMETSATIYLENDSVYHTNLGFSYNEADRQVNLFRTNNPVSGSPYYNSYHNIDMYFQNLSWNMSSHEIIISRAKGAALGEALFESSAFFNSDYFFKLMGLDEYHPLTRLKRFSEWYYSETFPVSEFAKWLNKPEEAVTGLCIDMANRGFVFYNRANREVTIKKKLYDFIDSFAGKKDYDIISVYSETKAPQDNAILDLNNYNLTINGVSGVFLSDSQKVAIYPYKKQLVIEKDRGISFDGIVRAGLFTFYGHKFRFDYDTFKLDLQEIDSIKIAIETDKRDQFGYPVSEQVDNIIQLAKAELYIDDPNNKSGLKSLSQYPIVSATTPSYIFFDKIPDLEGIYKQEDFYFKVNPFTYENIDHYRMEDLSLSGEFRAGNILEPMSQYLTIQDDRSLGFKMNIPKEGIEIYEGKGRIYDSISMSNRGLIAGGTLKHLTSTTISDKYILFPDSMLTQASTFNMEKDADGVFPELESQDVTIKWLTRKDEWSVTNQAGKQFDMFNNGTVLDGNLKLTPSSLMGAGTINMTDSRITSNNYTFSAEAIRADTADYFLKSASTSGYAFVAENANANINFADKTSKFHLNTDASMVKFPELQYICTMTDFEYNMVDKVLNMEQRDMRASASLISPDKMIAIKPSDIEKPTFLSTNRLNDTISFASLKARYYVDKEYIEAENVNYIPVADALIQPENGKMTIGRQAKIDKLENAIVAVNNLHLFHSASINIESSKKYSGSAIYDYVDESNAISRIEFPEITVDTMTTTARGFIPEDQNFMLSPAFTFTGDAIISAREAKIMFTGAAGIIHNCTPIASRNIKFRGLVDPKNVLIPVSDKPRDSDDYLVYSGSFINIDSSSVYPSFLSPQRSWTDTELVKSLGFLYYDKSKSSYNITTLEKIADPMANGNIVTFDKSQCTLAGEGSLNFGANFDHVLMRSAGNYFHNTDSSKVRISAIMAFDFHFSQEALQMMSDEIRLMPSLKPVNLNTAFNRKGMMDLLGTSAASRMKEEMDLFGSARVLPKEYSYEILLNDVKLYWNEETSSFRSEGKIGIGFIGTQPVNVYVDGYVEIQRRRTGDLIDIYLRADPSTWYYFSYFKGVMMAQAGNNMFNSLLSKIKLRDRKHPQSTVQKPYTYMIAVEDRLNRFLKRMTQEAENEPDILKGLTR